MFAIRAVLAATMSPTVGGVLRLRTVRAPGRRAKAARNTWTPRSTSCGPATSTARWPRGDHWSRSSRRLNEIRRLHPALRQMRTIKFHHVDNDALLAYSKFDPVTGDAVLVVVTLNPFGPEEGTLWLDMAALGMDAYDRFWVRDEITGEEYHWGQANYVRLDPARAVAHILNMPLIPRRAARALCAANDGPMKRIRMTRTESRQQVSARPIHPICIGWSAGEHHDPHAILGAHEYGDHTVIRAFRPHALEVVARWSATTATRCSTSSPEFSRSRCRSPTWWTTGSR